jgi:hypothetical protein
LATEQSVVYPAALGCRDFDVMPSELSEKVVRGTARTPRALQHACWVICGGTTREALQLAAQVVAHPATSTWVRVKWGSSYLERENVFYRMLLIMGLSSYESLTGDKRYAPTLSKQADSLTKELLAAPLHLADDYPEECYPTDVLWAAAALKRAAKLGYGSREEVDRLVSGLLAVLNGPALASQGLPAFQVETLQGG